MAIPRGKDGCRYCEGKGWYWVPNGPDDTDREVCECTDRPEHNEDDSRLTDR